MPNDSASQFPLPAQTAPTVGGAPTPIEAKLTDEVAPDLSAPIFGQPATPSSVTPAPQPAYEPPPITPAPPVPATPASYAPSGPSPVTILLLLISIGAIAATYFFYQQSKSLSSQVTEITKTLQQQQIQQNQATPTPSPTATSTPTLTITQSTTPSPTLSPETSNLVISNIPAVITTAQKQYPDAQLLMIIATGVENPSQMTVKYWFRQTTADKKYLYILQQPGQDLSLVDQSVYVTPDNNIPSLNQLASTNQLGIDLPEAAKIAADACPASFGCAVTPISAQFIKTNVPLWQISYKPANGSRAFVVQIDSSSKKIIYKSL